MARFEYRVVVPPRKPRNIKGVRSHEDRFAAVLAEVMNDMARENWEYVRAESLPCEQRAGLTGKIETFQTVLVFRREVIADQKFFETPPARQIEFHEVVEDRTEAEVIFTSQHRAASAAPAPAATTEQESEEPATSAGVLSILKHRKKRLQQAEQARDDSEEFRLAGE